MIGHLTGTVRIAELEWMIVDVRGVGYEVNVPAGTAGRLRPDDDGRVSLWIHTSVREDAIDLYGFARRDDRRLFRLLTDVNRVGPQTGLATLSELAPDEIVRAVHSEDINTFKRVTGIGKKTAQRLILELQNKVDELTLESPEPTSSPVDDQHDDLRSALLNLGFQSSTIDGVIDELRDDADPDESIEKLVRRALQMLN